ncbi:hypothetical protein JT55_00450 [Rhodovulum sp. NI22]|nr:hypothetical protein JT55_00450 [Rhodovulum sp. NI22]
MVFSRFLFSLSLGFALFAAGSAGAGCAGGQPVADAGALAKALRGADGDTVLALAPGDYGALSLSGKQAGWKGRVTLCSADPAQPARFSSVALSNVSNLSFEDLLFDYVYTSGDTTDGSTPFRVSGGEGISFLRVHFDGDLATDGPPEQKGFPIARGLFVRNARDIRVEDSVFERFYRGAVFNMVDGVIFRGNDVHTIRSDGLNLVALHGALIEGNHFHDFARSLQSKDHSDMIQMWTRSTSRPSVDITIRGNRFNSGSGYYTQSIFLRNEMVDSRGAGRDMWYRNITIEDNAIINAQLHGITVGEVIGLTIRNNSVLRSRASAHPQKSGDVTIPRISVKPRAEQVTIAGNVALAVPDGGGQPDWTVQNNITVQDKAPGQPGYYTEAFVAPPEDSPARFAQFQVLPGGILDGAQAGAPMLAYDPTPPQVTPLIRAVPVRGVRSFTLDAGFSAGPDGPLADRGATFNWRFSDGATAQGVSVAHQFARGGRQSAILTITSGNRQVYATKLDIIVPN